MIGRKHWVGLYLLLVFAAGAFAEEEKEYMAAFMKGKKVGHAIHVRSVEDGKVTTSEEVSITISRAGIPMTVKTAETSVETLKGEPLAFDSNMDLGALGTMKVSGTVDKDGTTHLKTSSLGVEEEKTMPWPEGAVMAEGLRLQTLAEGLKPGAQYEIKMFAPSMMQMVTAKVVVGDRKDVDLLGRIVKLTEVTTTLSIPMAGAVTSTSYVDDDMAALKSVMPLAGMNVELVSCSKEFALGANDVLEFIDSMFVKSPESIDNLSSISSITYVLNPAAGADLVIPSTDNQKAERRTDGRVVLTIKPLKAPSDGTFPYQGNDPNLREATQPARFLQSDRKEIVDLARQAIGDTKDTAEAARRIEAFVARYIDNKSLSVGYASAAEVAESRQGDCSEFAVLTAALCRAAGIPAQVVVGVAYVKEFAGIEGFGGHAWARAYVGGDKNGQGGKWIGLDAAFKSGGRGGYDAGHIALATGDGEPGRFFNVASALGQFKIEKLQIERGR